MAKHIADIIEIPSTIKSLSEGVLDCSKKFMWDINRVNIFNNAYDCRIKSNNPKKNRMD